MNVWQILFFVSFLFNACLFLILFKKRRELKGKNEAMRGEKSRADRATKHYLELERKLEEIRNIVIQPQTQAKEGEYHG